MAFSMLMRSYSTSSVHACYLTTRQTLSNSDTGRAFLGVLTALDTTTTGISILQRIANYSHSLHSILKLLYLSSPGFSNNEGVWIQMNPASTFPELRFVFFFFGPHLLTLGGQILLL